MLHDRLANLYHHLQRWPDAIEQYTAVAQGMTHLGRPITHPALIEVSLKLVCPLPSLPSIVFEESVILRNCMVE